MTKKKKQNREQKKEKKTIFEKIMRFFFFFPNFKLTSNQTKIQKFLVKDIVVIFYEAFSIHPWMASYREENPNRNK